MLWLLRALPLFFFLPMIAHAEPWEAQNEEEALFIRRIADFWQEGEYQIVKKQIEGFLKEYPDSSFAQSLSATLGDLYIREKKFQAALEQYARITKTEISDRVFLNRMQCLLELQWFATLADECEQFLQKENLDSESRLRASYLLATSLYQQCINLPKDSEDLPRLAERAQPHFKLLLNSELSHETAQAFAHLCCILKDFASASEIYLNLAKQTGSNTDEMLFQAALLQAEFDKSLAMKTFNEVAVLNGPRAHDALYNQLVLSYDTGQYEDVLSKKAELLEKIPAERQSCAHLFFGRSHLQLKQYPEALQELLCYADRASSSEALRSALIDILETAYQLGDEPSLNIALNRLSEQFPDDPQIPKGMLAHAQLLKKTNQLEAANREIESLCSRFASSGEIEAARFEQILIDFQEKIWPTCRVHCQEYLDHFPHNPFSAHVWRYLATAEYHLTAENLDPALKEELAKHLEMLLKQKISLSAAEQNDWMFLLAKTDYELQRFTSAIGILEQLALDQNFSQRANAILLLALCYRDGTSDLDKFCTRAEEALALHADLLDEASLHIALFNGYLARNPESLDAAAEHLDLASQKTDIELDNLRWLADYYFAKASSELSSPIIFRQKAWENLNRFLASAKVRIHDLDETDLPYEEAIFRLADLHGQLGQIPQQMELLLSLRRQYDAHPTWAWMKESDVDLLLGSNYAQSGQTDFALDLFDRIIAKNPTMRSRTCASAVLQSTQIRIKEWSQKNLPAEDPGALKILSQLKTLTLQKTLVNEPIHLNAAIEYIDFQTGLETADKKVEKRLALLAKMKTDFETSTDLLSRDYQNSRKILSEKDCIVSKYMNFIDAQILFYQSKLTQNASDRSQSRQMAKKMFEEIAANPITGFIASKAREQLEQMDGN
jgi:TolA-binding protein